MGAPRGQRAKPIRWLLAAPLVLLAGCGRGCGSIDGDKAYEVLEGPVRAELVRKVQWAGGRLPGPATEFVVRVHTDPSFEVSACADAKLAGDAAGENIAFLCEGEQNWTVIRLRGGDRHLIHCNAPVGTEDAPDFSRMPSIREGANAILECVDQANQLTDVWAELVRAVQKDDGDDAAVELVLGKLDDPTMDVAWDGGLRALSDPARGRVRKKMCRALHQKDSSAVGYLRAAERCDLTESGVGEVALDRFKQNAQMASENELDTIYWYGAIAVGTTPHKAGSVACSLIDDLAASKTIKPLSIALSMIAETQTTCDELDALAESEWGCGPMLQCGEHGERQLCTLKELGAHSLLDTFRSEPQPETGRRPRAPAGLAIGRALLAAFYVRGEPPHALVLRSARSTRYSIAPKTRSPGETVVKCAEATRPGQPCSIGHTDLSTAICKLTSKETRGADGHIGFEIDDDKARVTITSHCGGKDSPCSTNDPCCAGLTCAGQPRDRKCAPVNIDGD